jgi:hypothetical protein
LSLRSGCGGNSKHLPGCDPLTGEIIRRDQGVDARTVQEGDPVQVLARSDNVSIWLVGREGISVRQQSQENQRERAAPDAAPLGAPGNEMGVVQLL